MEKKKMMMKLKTNYFILIFFIAEVCHAQNDTGHIILFNTAELSKPCGHPFTISDKIEDDPFFRKEIENYLYRVFIDEKCDSIDPLIFNRPSFKKIVIEIYSKSYFEDYSIYETDDIWKESYLYLILSCTNEEVFYKLCDELLDRYIDDALIAVWNKDARKLKKLDKYEKFYIDDPYRLCELIAIYHNSGMDNEKENLLKKLKKSDIEKYNSMDEMTREIEKIDYFDFMEIIYGGM